MGKYYLGIDIGTYESRGMILDDEFRVAADCSVSHTMDNPKPGWFEHDAETIWWGDFCKLSRQLIKEAGIDPKDIVGIASSTLGTDCLPVDKNCKPLRPAILYGIDARAKEEIAWLTEYYGSERVHDLFGHPINTGDTATKILWLKNKEPEVYEKTYKFLTGSSYITAKLTGRYVIDQFLAKGSFRPLYRTNGEINAAEAGLYCRPDQIAETAYSKDLAGYLTEDAARETGLAEGTPVMVGTGDSTSEALSAGLTEAGTAFFQFGSSMFFYYCTDRMLTDYVSPYGNGAIKGGKYFTIPDTFCLGDGTNAAGTLTRWVRNTLYREEMEAEERGGENAYAIMAREAEEIAPGSEGLMVLPYIYGERSPIQDPEASGMIFGLSGKHDRRHINRACLEAVGYSVLQHLILFEEMGSAPERIITAGGGTKNRTWMQIVCDMAGKPLTIPEPYQCSCYGDAMLAAIGTGRLKDFDAMREALPKAAVLQPDMNNHAYYRKHYEMYRELYLRNKDLMHQLKNKSK